MAKVTKHTVEVSQITLVLSQEEAEVLRSLTGRLGGFGEPRELSRKIFNELCKVTTGKLTPDLEGSISFK